MKKSVNRNTIWCETFVNHLIKFGITNVCISPGSRSTPLTLAFATNKNFKVYPIVDERSSGFFALGIAKKTCKPVVVVTTSGTAVAELYPAIIEAFYQRIPLIVCTADRPPYLRNKGANQTINQRNIYKNHIRHFADVGLPELSLNKFTKLKNIISDAISIAVKINPGPVHINFPFEKPFEPDSITNQIEDELLKKLISVKLKKSTRIIAQANNYQLLRIAEKIKNTRKGIFFCGYNSFQESFKKQLVELSEKTGYPIFADGSSGFRYGVHSKKKVIENFNTLIRSKQFANNFDPELIIFYGGSPTSNQMHEFVKNSKAEKILVNQFGDWNDPSLSAKTLIKIEPENFCKFVLNHITKHPFKKNDWGKSIVQLNDIAAQTKHKFFNKQKINFEPIILYQLINNLPSNCNLMISNSLPIRDVDFFSQCSNKNIKVYVNRGASGIDGINSTALGISVASKEPTFLLTGDLAFYHDLTGLYNSIHFKIPLTIILINNNGGGIFESLPISNFGKIYKDNFVTMVKLEFAKVVKAFNGIYYTVNDIKKFGIALDSTIASKKLSVIEIKTNSKLSMLKRQKLWQKAIEEINKYINDHKD